MTEKSQAQTYMAELLLALKSRGFTDIIINERPNGRVVFNAITAKYREQHFGLLFDKRGITLFEGAEMRDDQALVSWAYLRWQAITDDRGGIITQEIVNTRCAPISCTSLALVAPRSSAQTKPAPTQQPALF